MNHETMRCHHGAPSINKVVDNLHTIPPATYPYTEYGVLALLRRHSVTSHFIASIVLSYLSTIRKLS